ncbi:MAG: hypothetical protein R6W78_01230 [Bacteroidales bacterium]
MRISRIIILNLIREQSIASLFTGCLLVCLVLLVSCTETVDYFKEQNIAPELLIKPVNGDFPFSSSVDDSMKLDNYCYVMDYMFVNDDYSFEKISKEISDTNGQLEFLYNEHWIRYCPSDVGFHRIKIKVTDYYNQSSTVTLNLNVFSNLAPVAVLDYSLKGNILTLDASESYDRDARFGGYIVNYFFTVDGITMETNSNKLYFDINPDKSYVIYLTVIDNSGAMSQPDIKFFNY